MGKSVDKFLFFRVYSAPKGVPLTNRSKTITGEQLASALNYLIWLEERRQKPNLHPRKERDLKPIVGARKYVERAELVGILRQHDFATDAWSHVLGNRESDLNSSRYATVDRFLATCSNLGVTLINLEEISQLLEPELARYAHLPMNSPQKWQYIALLNYFHAFASGEVTERDLIAA